MSPIGNGDPRLAAFADVRFVIGDLAGAALAHAEGGTITLDMDAAGHGWYVDVSPAESSEFRVRLDRNVLAATPQSEAFGRFDLVTVLAHELGHVLGFDHDDAGRFAVMTDELAAGQRLGLAPAPQGGTAIDWGVDASAAWGLRLSPYGPYPEWSVSPNLSDFVLHGKGKDRASRYLSGGT